MESNGHGYVGMELDPAASQSSLTDGDGTAAVCAGKKLACRQQPVFSQF